VASPLSGGAAGIEVVVEVVAVGVVLLDSIGKETIPMELLATTVGEEF
jgi:hypothetical protein